MNLDGECHPDAFFLLPAIVFTTPRCECCDESQGQVVSLTWLCFSLHFVFGVRPHQP